MSLHITQGIRLRLLAERTEAPRSKRHPSTLGAVSHVYQARKRVHR